MNNTQIKAVHERLILAMGKKINEDKEKAVSKVQKKNKINYFKYNSPIVTGLILS